MCFHILTKFHSHKMVRKWSHKWHYHSNKFSIPLKVNRQNISLEVLDQIRSVYTCDKYINISLNPPIGLLFNTTISVVCYRSLRYSRSRGRHLYLTMAGMVPAPARSAPPHPTSSTAMTGSPDSGRFCEMAGRDRTRSSLLRTTSIMVGDWNVLHVVISHCLGWNESIKIDWLVPVTWSLIIE